ncbi:MAG: hypothetical protein WB767_09540, partial [Nocardioides sp.]
MHARTLTTGWASVAAIGLGLLAALSPAQSAAAADATCAGQEATLVGDGTWDHEIIGTDGVDVIVS